MRIPRLILFSIMFSGICNYAFSFETFNKEFNLGYGRAIYEMRDRGISPLLYSGPHSSLSLGYLSRVKRNRHELELNYMRGDISTDIQNSTGNSYMKNHTAQIQYSFSYRIKSPHIKNSILHIGIANRSYFSSYTHHQFVNSSVTNLFFSSLDIQASLVTPVNFKNKTHHAGMKLQLPFAAMIIRPDFAYIKPSGFLEHNRSDFIRMINSIEVTSFNGFKGVATELFLDYTVSSVISLRILYNWCFQGHYNENTYKNAWHLTSFKLIYKL